MYDTSRTPKNAQLVCCDTTFRHQHKHVKESVHFCQKQKTPYVGNFIKLCRKLIVSYFSVECNGFFAVRGGLTFAPTAGGCFQSNFAKLVFLDILCMGFVRQIKDLDSSAISKQKSAPGRSVNILYEKFS